MFQQVLIALLLKYSGMLTNPIILKLKSMKFIKYSFAAVALFFFASCLKPKRDFAGLRTDPGGIVVSLAEAQYNSTDANVIGFGFQYFANFSFSSPATESVRFLTLHISQPRSTKMSGPMTVKLTMVSD